MPPKDGGNAPTRGKPSMPEFNKLEELAVANAAIACGFKPQHTAPALNCRFLCAEAG
jgi:hypothetical protein